MKRRRALSHWSTVGTDRVTRLLQRLLQALTVERTLIAVSDRTQNRQELVRKRAASPIPSIKQSSLLVDVIKDVSWALVLGALWLFRARTLLSFSNWALSGFRGDEKRNKEKEVVSYGRRNKVA